MKQNVFRALGLLAAFAMLSVTPAKASDFCPYCINLRRDCNNVCLESAVVTFTCSCETGAVRCVCAW